MRTLRRSIRLKEGVDVPCLFTPHLFSFRDGLGLTLEVDSDDPVQIMEAYADVYCLAAINAWVLDGLGTEEEFPWTRGDFHEYMMTDPRRFGRDVDFAVEALTGKRVRELANTEGKVDSGAVSGPERGKKKASRWIGRLLRRSS